MIDWANAKDPIITKHHGLQEKILFDRLQIMPIINVLEIGCGRGRIGNKLIGRASVKEYLGIDLSAQRIKEFQEIDRTGETKVELGVGDFMDFGMHKLDYGRKFDFIIAVEVLMHIDQEHIRQFTKKMNSFLTDDGTIVTIDFSPEGKPDEYNLAPGNYFHEYDNYFNVEERIRIGRQQMFISRKLQVPAYPSGEEKN